MPDFTRDNTAVSRVIKKIRQDKARQKASKLKCTVTLQFKALTVVNDKSKVSH